MYTDKRYTLDVISEAQKLQLVAHRTWTMTSTNQHYSMFHMVYNIGTM